MFTQILLHRAEDGQAITLTSDRANSTDPFWHPDGDWIYVPTLSSARSLRDNVTFWSQLATLGISLFILADQIGGN